MSTNPTILHEVSGSRKKAVLLIIVLTIAFPIIFSVAELLSLEYYRIYGISISKPYCNTGFYLR